MPHTEIIHWYKIVLYLKYLSFLHFRRLIFAPKMTIQ